MKESLKIAILFVWLIHHSSAQLSSVEGLRNTSSCTISSFDIDCGTSAIAVDSITLHYHASCETTCCTYDSTHCSENLDASNRNDVRRQCSGKSSCNLDLSGVRQFCSLGTYEPSYVVVYYYCIPSARQLSICSSSSLQSSGSPLYLTSNNYPSVTTGDSTCSCSLEVYDCSSSVYLYIIDADLYSDTSTCEQSLEIKDSSNALLHEIKCESYYVSDITSQTLNKHYISINFLDNSVQNLEGVFFLGFFASVETSQFSLSCSAVPESRCVDCGTSIDIANGNATLAVENDSSNGASANVMCEDGYETAKETIICTDTGSWEASTCTEKNGDSKDTDDDNKGRGKEDDRSNVTLIIAIVVPVLIVIVLCVGIAIYCYFKYRTDTVSPGKMTVPEGNESHYPENNPKRETFFEENAEINNRRKLPPLGQEDNVDHGSSPTTVPWQSTKLDPIKTDHL